MPLCLLLVKISKCFHFMSKSSVSQRSGTGASHRQFQRHCSKTTSMANHAALPREGKAAAQKRLAYRLHRDLQNFIVLGRVQADGTARPDEWICSPWQADVPRSLEDAESRGSWRALSRLRCGAFLSIALDLGIGLWRFVFCILGRVLWGF